MTYPDDVEEHIARIIRCAVDQNVSLHRFALAPDGERWMFNGKAAPTLEEAHKQGCLKCVDE